MIPNDQPLRGQTLLRMLTSLTKNLDDATEFTEWERDFIRSANEQFDLKGNLSNKQAEIIERLYDK